MLSHKFTMVLTHKFTLIFTHKATYMLTLRKKKILLRDILLRNLLHTFVLVKIWRAPEGQVSSWVGLKIN